MRSGSSRLWIGLALGLPVALPVLWLTWRHGFDGLYGQDPYAYFEYASGPLRRALSEPSLPPPFFWPPGFPLLVAFAMGALGPVPAAGQLVSLLAGAAVPGLTYLLARELGGPEDGTRGASGRDAWPEAREGMAIAAGLVCAFTPQLWQSSAVVMSDTTALAAATAGALVLARFDRGRRGGWLPLAAGLAAFAVLTRWAYALVAFPFVGLALWSLRRRPRRRARAEAGAAALAVLVVLLPLLVSGWSALRGGEVERGGFFGDLFVYSWHPGNAFRSSFETADGRLEHPMTNGLFYLSAPARRAFFTPLIAPLLVPGLWVVLRNRRASALFLLVLWPAVVFGFHAGAPWQNFRFNLALLPPLAILTGAGFGLLARGASGRGRWLVGVWLVAGLTWMAQEGVVLTERFMERKSENLSIVRWVDESIPRRAVLMSLGLTLTIDHYTAREPRELFRLSPERLEEILADDRPAYLLVDVDAISGQWRDATPGVAYRWLRDGPGLELVGRRGDYSLFEVGRDGSAARVR